MNKHLFDPQTWGPHFWFFFHVFSNAYPNEPTVIESTTMKQVVETIPLLLPCVACQRHALEYINSQKQYIDWFVLKKVRLSVFFWQFHNHVNKFLNKPEFPYSSYFQYYGMSFPAVVWGPQFWFVFHMTSHSFPKSPSIIEKNAMKNFIIAVPLLIPDVQSKKNAIDFINTANIDQVVLNKVNLFQFWWKFHNYINKLLNKPQIKLDKAKEIYNFRHD
jgi:hypothetical protein